MNAERAELIAELIAESAECHEFEWRRTAGAIDRAIAALQVEPAPVQAELTDSDLSGLLPASWKENIYTSKDGRDQEISFARAVIAADRQLRARDAAQHAEVRNQAIEECAKAAEDEALVENLLNVEDLAYNNAVKHCANAIRALKGDAAMPTGSET